MKCPKCATTNIVLVIFSVQTGVALEQKGGKLCMQKACSATLNILEVQCMSCDCIRPWKKAKGAFGLTTDDIKSIIDWDRLKSLLLAKETRRWR